MKQIIKFKEQGFCYGVSRSIELVNKILEDHNTIRPIYLLGSLVHNKHVNDFFVEKGIIILDGCTRLKMLDQVESGTVIITAHGASQKVFEKAKEKKLNIVDATCPYVTKTVDVIKEYVNNGYKLAYVGKLNHPEVEAICDDIPSTVVVEENKDIPVLSKGKYILAHQTTLSDYDVRHTLNKVMTKYKNVELLKQICVFPEKRQQEINKYNFPDDLNLAIVVGDTKSNNATKLKELLLRKHMGDVIMVNSVDELSNINYHKYNNIYIASGTSTPINIVEQIYNKLKGELNE